MSAPLDPQLIFFVGIQGALHPAAMQVAQGGLSQEDKPFKCPVIGCEKAYKNQNGLKYHKAVSLPPPSGVGDALLVRVSNNVFNSTGTQTNNSTRTLMGPFPSLIQRHRRRTQVHLGWRRRNPTSVSFAGRDIRISMASSTIVPTQSIRPRPI